MPVKPEPPDVLYVTESGDGQLTATALPPPDGTSHQPAQQVLPPPPSLVPRPQLPGFHPTPARIPPGLVPGPPPIRMPPRIPMQQLPNGQSMTSLPQGQPVPQMMNCQMMSQIPPGMPGHMYPLQNGQVTPAMPLTPSAQMPVHPNGQPASQPISPVNTEPKVAPSNIEDDKDAADSASRRGIFGWSTIAKENLPVLFRKNEKYVAVRMVEFKLLSRFPNMFPEKLKDRPPLHSFYATEHEVKLLNEINYEHCDFEFGHEPFSTKDLVVKLQEFEAFYDAVEQSFPQNVLENMKFDRNRIVRGGWVQINNTVVPYLYRQKQRFVPLKVIRYAATLLISPTIDGQDARQEESDYLNHICKDAGISFDFDTTTKLVSMDLVCMLCQPIIQELPSKSPFENAKFVEVPPPQPAPPPAPLHGLSNMMNSLPYTGVPPNVTLSVPQSFPGGPAPQLVGPTSSAVGPPASESSQPTSSGSATTTKGPPGGTSTGASLPGPRAPLMHSLPCPRHPGSYMFGGGNPYFYQLSERFSGGPACPTSDTGIPSTSQSPPVSLSTPLQTSTPQQLLGPNMFPPGHRGYMPPPYMYPSHMMPPHGMPYGLPPPYPEQPTGNKNKETTANRRRRSSENSRSRGSTPVQFQPDRRSSGDMVSPTALSRTSSTDSLNNAGTSPRPISRGIDTLPNGRQSRQGDQVTQTTLPTGNVQSSTPNPQLGPRPPANPLPILNVPNFSSALRPNISQAQLFPNQNFPRYSIPGYVNQSNPVYGYQGTIQTSNASSAPPINCMPGVPNSVPGNLNSPTTQPAATGEPVPVSLGHVPLSAKITNKEHFGVSLPTVQREGSEFALIEDVVRQCFPLLPVPKFLYALEDVLCIPLKVCTAEMERSFISNLMNLNGQLQCSKMISVEQLDEYLPQLKYMFKENVNPLVMKYFEKLNPSDSIGVVKTEGSDIVGKEVSKSGSAAQTIVIDSDDDDTPIREFTASKFGTSLTKSGSEVAMKIKRKNSATAERIEEIISSVIEQYSRPEPEEAVAQAELQSKTKLQTKSQVKEKERKIVKTSEGLSAQAKADNLLSCISKQTRNDSDTQVPVNTDGDGREELASVEERVKKILNDAQMLKDKEEKNLLSLVKANGASNGIVPESTPKIVETVSLAGRMEKFRSIQDDAAQVLETLMTKKQCSVESVSLHQNDSEVSQGSTVNADAITENTNNQKQNSQQECCEQNNNCESKMITNDQADASRTVEIVSESPLSSDNLNLKDGEKRRLSGDCEPRILDTQSFGGQVDGKSLKVGEAVSSLDNPEDIGEAAVLPASCKPDVESGLDVVEGSSTTGDRAASPNVSPRCQLKVVDVVSLSKSEGDDSSGLWDNWESGSNTSRSSPVIPNQDSNKDVENGPSLSSVEPEGGSGDVEVPGSLESGKLKITRAVSLAEPVDVQKSVKDSANGADNEAQIVELESVPTAAAEDKSMETVTILDSSAENDELDDSVVVISENFSRKPSNSSNESSSKIVSPVSGVLSENNQDSCLKIFSVVGGCDVPVSSQSSAQNNGNVTVATSESGQPKVLSVGGKSKIVIAPSTSQKFHVSILNQGRGLKRSNSDSCDSQPNKRIMIKVENNNNPIKRPNKDETLIIKHNANDGSVTEVVCID